MKHTPGPWTHKIAGKNNWIYADKRVVAFIGGDDTLFTQYPGTAHPANARLIAAAPEMLEALQKLLGCSELNMDDMEPATRDAIQQAVDLVTPFEN